MSGKRLMSIIILLQVSFLFMPSSVLPGAFPDRPIEIVVPYSAGGSTDLICREMGELTKKYLGQPLIVVNKPGGGGSVGTGYVYKSKPDGYTIGGIALGTVSLRPFFYKVPYELFKLTPIIQLAVYPLALAVRSDSPWHSLEELLTYARNHPGKLKFATTGPYDINFLIIDQIARKHGIKWKLVPSGTGERDAITMLLGGHIDFSACGTTWLPHVKAGTLRVLVTYGGKKKFFPNVPTLAELGYNVPNESGPIIVGPPQLPSKIVNKLHDAFKKGMEDPRFEEAAKRINLIVEYRNGEELTKYLREFTSTWGDVLKKMGIKPKD